MKTESFKGIVFLLQFIESNAWVIFNYIAEIKSPVRAAVLFVPYSLPFALRFPQVPKLKWQCEIEIPSPYILEPNTVFELICILSEGEGKGLFAPCLTVLGSTGFTCFSTASWYNHAPQAVSLAFLPSFLNLLCSILLEKMVAKPGWLPFGWRSLDFPASARMDTMEETGAISSPNCRGFFFSFLIGDLIALCQYTFIPK